MTKDEWVDWYIVSQGDGYKTCCQDSGDNVVLEMSQRVELAHRKYTKPDVLLVWDVMLVKVLRNARLINGEAKR